MQETNRRSAPGRDQNIICWLVQRQKLLVMALTKAVVLVFSVAMFVWRSSDGYAAIGKVPVQNGSCIYNGTEVPPHEPLKLEHPCEEWVCDPVTGELSTTGCNRVEPGRSCTALEGRGVYPDCCEQIACY